MTSYFLHAKQSQTAPAHTMSIFYECVSRAQNNHIKDWGLTGKLVILPCIWNVTLKSFHKNLSNYINRM